MLTKDQAIHKALDVIQWMSGSGDFAPGGQAHEGWKNVQHEIIEINNALGNNRERPVTQTWVNELPYMQQGVLLGAIRGPDGVAKFHKVKSLIRWYRRCVIVCAFDGTVLTNPFMPGGGSFTGPIGSGDWIDDPGTQNSWEQRIARCGAVDDYIKSPDDLPHHYQLHFLHAIEIVGYKHPDLRIRKFWHDVYVRLVHALHLWPETEEQMDRRLGDNFTQWCERCDPAAVCSD
jgi:hypothetical protein